MEWQAVSNVWKNRKRKTRKIIIKFTKEQRTRKKETTSLRGFL